MKASQGVALGRNDEVDAMPCGCDLIDEDQTSGVIVDYAHMPKTLSRLLDYVRKLDPRRVVTNFGFA